MSTGILLINLGSPDSTDPKDVKTYLDEFLMDEYVIDLPYPLRYLLVKGIILNVRPKKSAHAYETIWWDDGSPLIVIGEKKIRRHCQPSHFLGHALRQPQHQSWHR